LLKSQESLSFRDGRMSTLLWKNVSGSGQEKREEQPFDPKDLSAYK